MLQFWNHILANFGVFIHVRSWILWYVCCMYLGTEGWFFLTCVFLWSPSVPLRFMGNLPLLSHMCTYSNFPLLKFRWSDCPLVHAYLLSHHRIIATSPQTIYHHHREDSHMTSYLRCTPNIHCRLRHPRHWMSIMAKKPPPSESGTHLHIQA